jgi:4-cresol dehydrogenase (hydroxylating)
METAHKVTYGIPNLEAFSSVARSAANPEPPLGHFDFAPIIPRDGEEILKAIQLFDKKSKELGMASASPVLINFQRSVVYELSFLVSSDAESNRKSRRAFGELLKVAATNGWGSYRTGPPFYDEVMNTYSYNNHILRRFHETLKDAIDPNGIISPGRYGLWPKTMRINKDT